LETPNKHRRYILAVSAILISTVLTVTVSEILLHVAARMFPQVEAVLCNPQNCDRSHLEPPKSRSELRELPDAELGMRGNPNFPEHDANGFRNAVIPDRADVVAIGDSQTYGFSVAPDQAWPRVLEKLTSCRVYSMAVGGYGPLQYAVLAQRALRFKPRLMLIGIYFGNDFYDNWKMFLRNPNKYPVPKKLLNSALESEQHNPLARDVEDFFRMAGTISPVDAHRAWSPRIFLAQNSSLWGFARAVKDQLFPPQTVLSHEFWTAVTALTPKQLENASIFNGTDWRTILTSRYREAVENIDDPRIKVGVWLTQWAMENIVELANQQDIAVIFILLPTKESVFVDKVNDANGHKYLKKLTTEEDWIRQSLIQYMEKNTFVYINMAPSLRAMVQQPYFENADGHPNVFGQEKIARKLLEPVGICKH